MKKNKNYEILLRYHTDRYPYRQLKLYIKDLSYVKAVKHALAFTTLLTNAGGYEKGDIELVAVSQAEAWRDYMVEFEPAKLPENQEMIKKYKAKMYGRKKPVEKEAPPASTSRAFQKVQKPDTSKPVKSIKTRM